MLAVAPGRWPTAGLSPRLDSRASSGTSRWGWCSSSRPGTIPTSPRSTASSRRSPPATSCCSSIRRRRRLCAERFQEAFDAAGLPPGVFQHLHMSHDAALRIVGSGAAQLVAFTGSVPGGPCGPGGGRPGLHRHQPGARRQGPGLCPRGRRPRPRGREPGRRRLLQLGPELLRDRADLRASSAGSTRSSQGYAELAAKYVLGDPDRGRDHSRPDGPGDGRRFRPRPGRRGRGARAPAR